MQTKSSGQAGGLTAEQHRSSPLSDGSYTAAGSVASRGRGCLAAGRGCMRVHACLRPFPRVSARVVCAVAAWDRFQPGRGVPGGGCSGSASSLLAWGPSISGRAPLESKAQRDGHPADGKNLLCFPPGRCCRARRRSRGRLGERGVWAQGVRNVCSRSPHAGEFSLVPRGARWRSLPRTRHLHN